MMPGKRILCIVILFIAIPASGFGEQKKNYYERFWRTHQMSDHLPKWIELRIGPPSSTPPTHPPGIGAAG